MHVLIPALHRPTKPTGVCRHAVNLAQALSENPQIHRITLLIGSWQQAYFNQSFNLKSSKIAIAPVEMKNTSFSRNKWFVFDLPKVAAQIAPDVIHLSFPFPFRRDKFSVPVVATVHDLYPYEYPENFGYPRVWFNQLFLQQCIRNSDGLVCVSYCTLDALLSAFPNVENKSSVIYNVVDFSDVVASIPAQLAHHSAQPFLMSVAQHRKNKNLDLLIKAYGHLISSEKIDQRTQLILVGSEGPETEALTQLVRSLQLEDRVMFLSGLEDGELRWLYEQAALFVIPSSTEGFCLPLVEALTLLCPAVCSDIPIFREVASPGGYFFDLHSHPSKHLSDAILLALSQDTVHKSVANNQFSRQTISQQLVNFYQSFSHNSSFKQITP